MSSPVLSVSALVVASTFTLDVASALVLSSIDVGGFSFNDTVVDRAAEQARSEQENKVSYSG